MNTGAPCPVAHIAAAFFPGLLGQVLAPAFRAITTKWFEVNVITVLIPELSDNVIVLAGGIDDQMMMESASGVIAFRNPHIDQLLA